MALTSLFAGLGLPSLRAVASVTIIIMMMIATARHVMDARADRLAYGAAERAAERAAWEIAAERERARQADANRAALAAADARARAAEARAAELTAQIEEMDRAAAAAPGADLPVLDRDLVRRLRRIQ